MLDAGKMPKQSPAVITLLKRYEQKITFLVSKLNFSSIFVVHTKQYSNIDFCFSKRSYPLASPSRNVKSQKEQRVFFAGW